MEIMSICISSSDAEYAHMLIDVLKINYEGLIGTVAEDGCDVNNIRQDPAIDLFITDKEDELFDGAVFLTENPAHENTDNLEKPFRIFKYTSAKEFIGKLIRILSLKRKRAIFFHGDRSEGRVTAVCSSTGGTGCTSIALALCRELATFRNKKIFYISMEQFPSANEYIRAEKSEVKLKRMLYDLKHDKTAQLENSIVSDIYGIFLFGSDINENPLVRLCDKEIYTLIERIFSQGGYDHLIVDTGSMLEAAQIAMLSAADRIILLKGNRGRDERYLRYLRFHCGENITEKIVLAENKYADGEVSETAEENKAKDKNQILDEFFDERNALLIDERDRDFTLPYCPEAFTLRQDMLDIEPAGEFGKRIRDMAKLIDR